MKNLKKNSNLSSHLVTVELGFLVAKGTVMVAIQMLSNVYQKLNSLYNSSCNFYS